MQEVHARPRRTPNEVAIDAFKKALRKQERNATRAKAIWEDFEASAERTRRWIIGLGMESLPGMALEPAQDTPSAQRTGTIAPVAEVVVLPPIADAPVIELRPLKAEEAMIVAHRAAPSKCKHDKVQGWCSKSECQEEPHG